MSRLRLTSATRDGRQLALAVADRGGKITSLSCEGRQWLSQPAGPPVTVSPSGLGFLQAELAGWDECAPTINASQVDGVGLRDHGDLWDRPWRLRAVSGGIEASVAGADWPYSFTRTAVAVPGGFRLHYRVASRADVTMPLLWAAHPQFLAGDDSWVELPGIDRVVDTADPTRELAAVRDLQRVADGGCRKLWTAREDHPDRAILHHGDGRRLTLSWQGADVRWCGVWIDAHCYAPGRVIAVEPSTGWFDDAGAARENQAVLELEPGGVATWSVVLDWD